METGLLHEYFGKFSTQAEQYYFTQGEIEAMRGEIETNRRKLEKCRNAILSGHPAGTSEISDLCEISVISDSILVYGRKLT